MSFHISVNIKKLLNIYFILGVRKIALGPIVTHTVVYSSNQKSYPAPNLFYIIYTVKT